MGNIGPVLPEDGYLADIREITAAHDTLLIFDEVITGYRVGIGGAQVRYGVKPDLATFGKIIGGGLPIGAFGGGAISWNWSHLRPGLPGRNLQRQPCKPCGGVCNALLASHHPEAYRHLDEAVRAIEEAAVDAQRGSFVRMGSLFKHFFRRRPPGTTGTSRSVTGRRSRGSGRRCLMPGSSSRRHSLRRTLSPPRTADRISRRLRTLTGHVSSHRHTGERSCYGADTEGSWPAC